MKTRGAAGMVLIAWALFATPARALVVQENAARLLLSADPSNGVLSGFGLSWGGGAANTNVLSLRNGEAFVGGNQVINAATLTLNVAAGAANALADGVVMAANTSYYAYLLYDAAGFGVITTTWTCVLSRSAPTFDGLAPGIIKKNTHGGGTKGVFVGSMVTDSSKNTVPFVRTGREIILNVVNTNGGCAGAQLVRGAGAVPFTFTQGADTQVVDFAAGNAAMKSCDNNKLIPYPLSASAMLVDIQLSNNDAQPAPMDNVHDFVIEPPTEVTDATQNPNYPNYQAHFLSSVSTDQYVNMLRLTPQPDSPGPGNSFTIFMLLDFKGNNNPAQVSGWFYYRGYVEAIRHLSPGQTPPPPPPPPPTPS
jgi:hypothetical protein